MEIKKKRNLSLDLIRIFACFCVIGIHFFLNSGFYQIEVSGKSMLIMSIFRSLFIIAVTLFITLTGYLMNKKELSKKYYKGIIRIIIIYIICSIIYHIFISIYYHTPVSFLDLIKNILSYNGTRYSWYIEMYIGLFLMIPFLNLIFNNLKNQKEAKILMITLIVIIGLPPILNSFRFGGVNYVKILPSWWSGIYPIFYYFLGAYLSRYKIKISRFINLIVLIVFLILDGLYNYYCFYKGTYAFATWNDYSSVLVMSTTLLVFNIILNTNLNDNSKIKRKILIKLSDATLGAYLVSCIFDAIVYERLAIMVPNLRERLLYAPLVVIIVFASSMTLSLIINVIYDGLKKFLVMLKKSKNEI